MLIYCNFKPVELYSSLHELIRRAYPGCQIIKETGEDDAAVIQVDMETLESSAVLKGSIISSEGSTILQEEHFFTSTGKDRRSESKRAARVFIYKMLCEHLGRDINPYGILTGVRPVKLVHKFMDKGLKSGEIANILRDDYRLNADKAGLLLETAENNRHFLLAKDKAKKLISIYIGIPFCPSRCYYCSFPGAVLKDYQQDINPFLDVLLYEMNSMADCLQEQNISIQSIYIGGGTPTVLSERDLERIFSLLNERYISRETAEITVEAGRPDTLNPAKLKILKDAGVTRVCVNPQTMNDTTLQSIGRNHDAKGVVQSIEWVREAGIKQINMDLIVGLPGENLQENRYTADEILKLRPENITVHTLALKRGSKMADIEDRENIGDRVNEVEKGVEFFSEVFRGVGYIPYYLYRQKYMKAGMENTGYTLPGKECLYNIQMIEERQTIIGMGGGAASKFVNPGDWTLTSSYNPKDPISYCTSIEKLIKRKVDKLWTLN